MRQYMVDELRRQEVERIRAYLEKHCDLGGIDNIYWLNIPDDLLSPVQYEHRECRPFSAAVELGKNWVKFEMLIRSRVRIRCKCIHYASGDQQALILRFADKLLRECEVSA